MDRDIALLENHLPPETAAGVLEALRTRMIFLRIKPKRSSKLADFRPATRTLPHRITMNHDLNKYEFLFTLMHELAHYEAFKLYGRKHKPHGTEWRNLFRSLINPYLERNVFPPDLEQGILAHFGRKGLTDCSDGQLHELFKRYDKPSDGHNKPEQPTVDMLPLNSRFALPDGRQFIKLKLRRKRFSCYCYNDKRMYVFGPRVPVIPVNVQD